MGAAANWTVAATSAFPGDVGEGATSTGVVTGAAGVTGLCAIAGAALGDASGVAGVSTAGFLDGAAVLAGVGALSGAEEGASVGTVVCEATGAARA